MTPRKGFTARVRALEFTVAELADTGGGEGSSNLPVGGTTNQVLRKASPADGDVEWADAAGSYLRYRTY